MTERKKVLVVDDSATYRGLIHKVLANEDDIKVIGSVAGGEEALEFIRDKSSTLSTYPDIVTLDVEMPGLSGLETLEKIQEFIAANPELPEIGVIMVSAFTRKGADITIRALETGAFDFIAKPETGDMNANMETLRRQLLVKIRHFAVSRSRRKKQTQLAPVIAPPPHIQIKKKGEIETVRAVLVGVSTGGPKALVRLLPPLSQKVPLPVFITQHMPATFTRSLAETLDHKCSHRVIEVEHTETVNTGTIYLAPGGKHMLLMKNQSGEPTVITNDEPPENGFRPSVDVLFRSAAAVYGGNVVVVILTGMGSDGTRGMGTLKRLGAHTIVQDEATSVVWGMPQSAVEAGYVDEIQPLELIPQAIEQIVYKKR